MPIYAYRCASCGHAQDVLQKISDPVHTVCPACGAAAYEKQVTAAGFQLKGSGWYVTDFRGGNSAGAKKDEKDEKVDAKADAPADAKSAETKTAETKTADAPAPAAAPAPASAPAPAATPSAGA